MCVSAPLETSADIADLCCHIAALDCPTLWHLLHFGVQLLVCSDLPKMKRIKATVKPDVKHL